MEFAVSCHEFIETVGVIGQRIDEVALALSQVFKTLKLFICSVFDDQIHCFGFDDQTDLIPIGKKLFLIFFEGETKGIVLFSGSFRNKSTNAAPNDQNAVCNQNFDRFAQGGTAYTDLFGKASLVRHPVTRMETVLLKNHISQMGCNLLGERLSQLGNHLILLHSDHVPFNKVALHFII